MADEVAAEGSVVTEPLRDPMLYRARVQLLYENLPSGLLVAGLNGAILATIEWHAVPAARLWGWLFVMALVTFGRYLLTHEYHSRPTSADPVLWGRRYIIGAALAGGVWGAASLLLFPQALLPQIFVFFMLTAMTTAAVVSFAPAFPVALAFVIPTLAPLALRLFLAGGTLHHAMAIVSLVFLGVMLLTAKRMERTIAASLHLRFENRDLIAALKADKAAIHRLNTELTREIAARTEMTEDLREREAYLRAVLENVDEGIVTMDARGALLSLNREALRIFGYPEDELLGSHFSRLVPDGERAEYTHLLEEQAERGGGRMTGLGLEVNGLKRDGSVFPMEVGVSVMQVGGERRFIAITRDVSARKHAERLRGDTLEALSHEMKTPLAAALGALGLLAEGTKSHLTGDDVRLLKMARNNLNRLARAVSDILDTDRENDRVIEAAPLLFLQVAQEALAAERDYAADRQVRLALDPCSSAALIRGDRTLLVRAVGHLITHAVHLAPPDSTVELSVVTAGEWGVLSVRDCGAPIPVAARTGLFEGATHLAVHGVVAPRALYSARLIAERHGGSVGYESREAGGSHFFMRLPLFFKDPD